MVLKIQLKYILVLFGRCHTRWLREIKLQIPEIHLFRILPGKSILTAHAKNNV